MNGPCAASRAAEPVPASHGTAELWTGRLGLGRHSQFHHLIISSSHELKITIDGLPAASSRAHHTDPHDLRCHDATAVLARLPQPPHLRLSKHEAANTKSGLSHRGPTSRRGRRACVPKNHTKTFESKIEAAVPAGAIIKSTI